jgi:hypothetical protein
MVVVVLAGGASAREAQACHRFSVWKYPAPQRCRVFKQMRAEAPPPQDRSWFVELTATPVGSQDEADQAEHDAAVAAHKDELNRLLNELHEDARLNHIEPRIP